MAATVLRGEERIGLVVALAAHAALLALMMLRPPAAPIPPPERIEVTLSEDVGLTSTSPEPKARAASDVAPELGKAAPPPPAPPAAKAEAAKVEPKPEPRTEPKPLPRVQPPRPEVVKPPPKPVVRPEPRAALSPRPVVRPSPKPASRPVARATPAPRPSPRAVASPAPRPATKPAPATRSTATAVRSTTTTARTTAQTGTGATPRAVASPTARAGGSRIGSDFLKGVEGAQTTGASRNPPAAAIGPEVRSALSGAISRQLKPHWLAPQGADAEQLVTILSWTLNRDGTLTGTPQVVRQTGITDANRPQAHRHAEQAVRAVQLAAPFNLPAEHYDAWKRVASFRFDKRLSQ